jgi:hypothetical protein
MNVRATFFTTIVCLSLNSFGQEKIREFHVNSNLSMLYKQQFKKSENFLWNAGLSHLNMTFTQSSSNFKTGQVGLGIITGLEFRKPMTEFVSLYHGPSIAGYTHDFYASSSNNPNAGFFSRGYGFGVMYNFGLLFKINDNFLMTAQISPAFSYYTNNTTQVGSTTMYQFSLNEFPISAGFVYRF